MVATSEAADNADHFARKAADNPLLHRRRAVGEATQHTIRSTFARTALHRQHNPRNLQVSGLNLYFNDATTAISRGSTSSAQSQSIHNYLSGEHIRPDSRAHSTSIRLASRNNTRQVLPELEPSRSERSVSATADQQPITKVVPIASPPRPAQFTDDQPTFNSKFYHQHERNATLHTTYYITPP